MNQALLPKWRDDWALFLDVDGTILSIAPTPAAVSVPERAIQALGALKKRLAGALALISGRSIEDLDRMFAPLRLPLAGVHGAERRDALGREHRYDYTSALTPAKQLLRAWTEAHSGSLLEDKGAALALHYRGVPELEAAARRAASLALAAAGSSFQLQEGKKVLEIKAGTVSKGRAIADFMREEPFAGRLPVFLGDDLTDEDGFEMVNGLGGHSIAVGVNRRTQARWHLDNEQQVLDWLETNAGGTTE